MALWVKGGLNWLTNRRWLLYAANLRDRTLVQEYQRDELLRVHVLER